MTGVFIPNLVPVDENQLTDAALIPIGESGVSGNSISISSLRDVLRDGDVNVVPNLAGLLSPSLVLGSGVYFLLGGVGAGDGLGGDYVYSAVTPKSDHDGVNVISQTVPFNGTIAGIDDFNNGVGETDVTGIGAFIRISNVDPEVVEDPVSFIDDLRALTPTVDGQKHNLIGHTQAGLGGGVFYYDANDTSSLDDNGLVIVTVTGERFKRVLPKGIATPEDFGFISGDGTAEVKAAAESGYKCLINRPISIDSINVATRCNITIDADLTLLTPGTVNARGFVLSGAGSVVINNAVIDGAMTSRSVFQVVADDCTVHAGRVNNISADAASTPSVSGIEVANANGFVGSINGHNHVNTGQNNVSVPRLISINGTSKDFHITEARGVDVNVGVLRGGSSDEAVGRIDLIDVQNCEDNGLYNLSGTVSLGTIVYRGNEEAVVQSAIANIGKIETYGAGNTALAIDDAVYTNVDSIVTNLVDGGTLQPIRARTGNVTTGVVNIGSITGEIIDGNVFGLNNGVIEDLNISTIDLTFYYTGGTTVLSQLIDLGAVQRFNVGSGGFKIDFVDTTDTLSFNNRPQLRLPLVTAASHLHQVDFQPFESDGITRTTVEFRIVNPKQEFLTSCGLRLQVLNNIVYGREVDYGAPDTIDAPANLTQATSTGFWTAGEDYALNGATAAPFRARITSSGEGVSGTPPTIVTY